jgi:hypothetical protein
MLRRTVGAALVLFVLGGFVLAETYQGLVTELKKDSVTVMVRKKGEKESTKKVFKVNADTKLQKAGKKKGDEPTTVTADDIHKAIEKGIKIKGKDEPIKGVFAKIETSGDGDKETATSITVVGRRGGPKKKKDE